MLSTQIVPTQKKKNNCTIFRNSLPLFLVLGHIFYVLVNFFFHFFLNVIIFSQYFYSLRESLLDVIGDLVWNFCNFERCTWNGRKIQIPAIYTSCWFEIYLIAFLFQTWVGKLFYFVRKNPWKIITIRSPKESKYSSISRDKIENTRATSVILSPHMYKEYRCDQCDRTQSHLNFQIH